MSNTQVTGSFSKYLLLLFITLKLCGVISWSWWCLIPILLLPVLIYVGTFLAVGAVTLLILALTGAWGFFFKK